MPEGDLFDPPPEMTEAQKVVWRRQVSRSAIGQLHDIDADILQTYCETWCERQESLTKQRALELNPDLDAAGQRLAAKYALRARQAREALRGLFADLGFSPTARTRISTAATGARGSANRFSNNAAKNRA